MRGWIVAFDLPRGVSLEGGGRVRALPVGKTTFGRSVANDLVVHCEILGGRVNLVIVVETDGRAFVSHAGHSLPITINGARLRDHELADGDVVEPASLPEGIRLRFYRGGEPFARAAVEDVLREHAAWLRSAGQRGGVIADLAHTRIDDFAFDGLDLSGVHFDHAELTGCRFRRTELAGASFAHARLVDCDLSRASLVKSSFFEAELERCRFDGANLARAELIRTRCVDVSFQDADLTGVLD